MKPANVIQSCINTILAVLLVLPVYAHADDGEVKVKSATHRDRATACADVGKALENDTVQLMLKKKLVSVSSCDCSKAEDLSQYVKGEWTCTAKGIYK